MMLSKEKLKFRKIQLVLQYHVLSKERYPEEYTNHILFVYFPFRDEEELKYNNSNSNKLDRPSVIEILHPIVVKLNLMQPSLKIHLKD